MQELKTKVGYIRGLIDGLGLDDSKKEGKVLLQIVELLDQMTESILELDAGYDDLVDYVEAIDEDLMELEDDFYEEDEDGDYDDDIFSGSGGYTFECPNCREMVHIEEEALDEDENLEILCPECGEVILIDEWDDDDESIEDDIPFEEEVIDDEEKK